MTKAKNVPATDEMVLETINGLSEKLNKTKHQPMTLSDVIGVAEVLTHSLQPLLRRIDSSLQTELRGILLKIEQLRDDISKVHAQDISLNRIPEVGKELSEIVTATEGATNSIMEAAESVLAASDLSESDFRELVEDKMMIIFEACSFQDITGQRVNKVVETIEVIEERINVLCEMMDATLDNPGHVLSDKEKERKEQLLNGPSSDGIDQSAIDAMF